MNVRVTALATSLAALALAPTSTSGQAASPDRYDPVDGLQSAVDFYHANATSDFPTMLEATRRLEAVAAAHPVDEENTEGWLAAYWTSFVYTQLTLFAGDERSGPYAELARIYFERARAAKPDDTPEMNADFAALEGMVLSFLSRSRTDSVDSLRQQAQDAWDRARGIDPDNPMVLMTQGLDILPDEATRDSAYTILERAIERYEPRMGRVRPNWGREFIDVWTGRYPRLTDVPAASESFLDDRTAADWQVRQDRKDGGGDPPRLAVRDRGLSILTGAAGILYPRNPRHLSIPFRLEAEFEQFDPGGRNEAYGVLLGGQALDRPAIRYVYFLIRQDGSALLKLRDGDRTRVLRPWTVHDPLLAWDERDSANDRIANRLAVEARRDRVTFLGNGKVIWDLPVSDLPSLDGVAGLRVNHGLRLLVRRLDFTSG